MTPSRLLVSWELALSHLRLRAGAGGGLRASELVTRCRGPVLLSPQAFFSFDLSGRMGIPKGGLCSPPPTSPVWRRCRQRAGHVWSEIQQAPRFLPARGTPPPSLPTAQAGRPLIQVVPLLWKRGPHASEASGSIPSSASKPGICRFSRVPYSGVRRRGAPGGFNGAHPVFRRQGGKQPGGPYFVARTFPGGKSCDQFSVSVSLNS